MVLKEMEKLSPVAVLKKQEVKSNWFLNPGSQQVFTNPKAGDFSKKIVRFTVTPRTGGEAREYLFTTSERSGPLAVADIARQVNRAIPAIRLGEKISDDTIRPLASPYRNKIWVAADKNEKPQYIVVWDIAG